MRTLLAVDSAILAAAATFAWAAAAYGPAALLGVFAVGCVTLAVCND